MDILSLIDKFIQWCDGNVGFLNVILSLCTLILTVTIAKLPYQINRKSYFLFHYPDQLCPPQFRYQA